jgi:hypothetical protein
VKFVGVWMCVWLLYNWGVFISRVCRLFVFRGCLGLGVGLRWELLETVCAAMWSSGRILA